jgi:hypothetical protein
MDVRHHELAEGVNVLGLDPCDHLVGAGERLGGEHSLECADFFGDVSSRSHLGLDEYMCPPCAPPSVTPGSRIGPLTTSASLRGARRYVIDARTALVRRLMAVVLPVRGAGRRSCGARKVMTW